ncbi:MAG: OmpH family outer membrane protein [Verrucomicrobiota bacterium]
MKLSHSLAALAISLGFGWPASLQAAEDMKIGIVDMQSIFSQFYRTQEAETDVNEQRSVIKKEVDERRARQRELIQKAENLKKLIDEPSTTEDFRKAKFQEYNGLLNELRALEKETQEYIVRKQRQIADSSQRTVKGIFEEISELVESVAKEDGYDLVFDKSGLSQNRIPFLLYSKDAVDFSQKIVDKLNADAPEDFDASAEVDVPVPAVEGE